MDYIDAATTGTLSPHILPIMDLKKMLSHIEDTLPFTLHLPVSSAACSATSPSFHLPPHYEGPPLEVNISLDMVNLNMINISSVNFHIWQHLEKHWNESQLQHLASIP